MGSNNNIAIISDSDFIIQEIKNMLVLLREVDKVEGYEYFDAEERVIEDVPSAIIIHTFDDNKNAIKIIKKIRANEKTSKTPIILYTEIENTEFIVEAFDNGVSDILSAPLKDYELIIRVIWAIQKNDSNIIEQIKKKFLSRIDVYDEKTGFYNDIYSMKFLETVVDYSRENNQDACLMLLKTSSEFSLGTKNDEFINILKNTVRTNDTIVIKDFDNYYVLLLKSKLNGVYSVYERLLNALGPVGTLLASVVEIKDEMFDTLINVLDYTLKRANKGGEIVVVKEQDYIDMYDNEDNELQISRILNEDDPKEIDDVPATKNISIDNEDEESYETGDSLIKELGLMDDEEDEQEPNNNDKLELGLQMMKEEINKVDFKKEELLNKERNRHIILNEVKKEVKNEAKNEIKETDRRTAILYKQAWAKKLRLVVQPIFEKYASKFQKQYPTLDANLNVAPYHSFLKFDKNDVRLYFEIFYSGLKTINFKITIYAAKVKLEEDNFEFEVMNCDRKKLDVILKTTTDEYRNYLQDG